MAANKRVSVIESDRFVPSKCELERPRALAINQTVNRGKMIAVSFEQQVTCIWAQSGFGPCKIMAKTRLLG
jgi:hypothetical protein